MCSRRDRVPTGCHNDARVGSPAAANDDCAARSQKTGTRVYVHNDRTRVYVHNDRTRVCVNNDGTRVTLGQVATVVDGFEGDMQKDPGAPGFGRRTINGWKNAGLPWTK